MYTQCPECQTVYGLEQAQLDAASSQVRCGACNTVFNAQTQQLDSLPIPVATAKDPGSDERLDQAANRRGRTGLPKTAAWSFASLLLVLGLTLQTGYLMREQLSTSEPFAPFMKALCATLHCTLPLPHDPEQIELVDYAVTPHPEHANVWHITGALLNTADFDQHYPTLRISLPQTDGSLLAARDFSAAEYLTEDEDPEEYLYRQEAVDIRLDIIKPGQHTAALRIDIY